MIMRDLDLESFDLGLLIFHKMQILCNCVCACV